ncbi:MAG TPA: integration host factor subunit beta [Alphaproteobacteria bacterium]|nr:integration host factor subunit beta [Alphaproteobacteria bacterium]
MTKSEIIKILKDKNPHLQLKEVASAVDIFFDMIMDTLKKDGRIEIRGFGTFSIRKRKGRIARNPRTGEKVEVKERRVVYFRAGKGLKDQLNKTS